MSNPTSVRRYVESAFLTLNQRFCPTYEVSHLATLGSLVSVGLGVSALSKLAAQVAPKGNTVQRPLIEPELWRSIGVVTRRGRSLSIAAAAMVEQMSTILTLLTQTTPPWRWCPGFENPGMSRGRTVVAATRHSTCSTTPISTLRSKVLWPRNIAMPGRPVSAPIAMPNARKQSTLACIGEAAFFKYMPPRRMRRSHTRRGAKLKFQNSITITLKNGCNVMNQIKSGHR
jgi:hypothetical protein